MKVCLYFVIKFKVIQNQSNCIQKFVFWQGSITLYQIPSTVYDYRNIGEKQSHIQRDKTKAIWNVSLSLLIKSKLFLQQLSGAGNSLSECVVKRWLDYVMDSP